MTELLQKHNHAHDVDSEAHESTRERRIERGSGKGKTLFFDAFSGLSGDMINAALVDLGVPVQVLADAIAALGVPGLRIEVGHAHRSGIVATTFRVAEESPEQERTYKDIVTLISLAKLGSDEKELALRVFHRLAQAEARVHRVALDDVHFHEVGGLDAIADIVCAATALAYLGATVAVSPLPLGRGFVKSRHGILPLPAPATVECLRGIQTYGVPVDAELVTPTGAAISATAAAQCVAWPRIVPEHTGFGAGAREFSDRPNVLRIVLGTPSAEVTIAEQAASHVVVETNIDDMTSEALAYAVEKLLAMGALDAWVTPVVMKKGRAAHTLSVLCERPRTGLLAQGILRETTSLGVRVLDAHRVERLRRIETVATPFGDIRVKIAEDAWGPPRAKPEYDDCAKAARAHGVPLAEVVAAATKGLHRPA